MRYEVSIGVNGISARRNIVVEADDEITAAFRAGYFATGIRHDADLEVLAVRSEQQFEQEWES